MQPLWICVCIRMVMKAETSTMHRPLYVQCPGVECLSSVSPIHNITTNLNHAHTDMTHYRHARLENNLGNTLIRIR